MEIVCHEDRGRAVRRTDDADGGGVYQLKPEQARHTQREEDAELRRRPEEQHFGVGEQRAEVDHGTDANKEDEREQLVGDAGVKQDAQGALLRPLRNRAGHGQVYKDDAKAHGQQQRGLHFLFDGQVDENCTDNPHDGHLPGDVGHIFKQCDHVGQKFFHRSKSFV